ncbi:uncharacterized protein L201_002229 [Kwoniella dendrophila CBS 6074]|uniref:Uncharacterized protein n=1 Tax=Kwoniella dendrophila CBS 6074 TaxID=1295534 RepID=A0AAX4JPM5_9TREE
MYTVLISTQTIEQQPNISMENPNYDATSGSPTTHLSSAARVGLKSLNEINEENKAERKYDFKSSIFYWNVHTGENSFYGSLGYQNATWYGTDITGRKQVEKLEDRCSEIESRGIREFISRNTIRKQNLGKPKVLALFPEITLKQTVDQITRSINEVYPNSARTELMGTHHGIDVAVTPIYHHQKSVSLKTINDISRIQSQMEKYPENNSNGFLVLSSKEDPTIGTDEEGLISAIVNSDRETITDLRLLINASDNEGTGKGKSTVDSEANVKSKLDMLNKLANHYISEKTSNEYPSSSSTKDYIDKYPGCQVIKVWDGTLNEFNALQDFVSDEELQKALSIEKLSVNRNPTYTVVNSPPMIEFHGL